MVADNKGLTPLDWFIDQPKDIIFLSLLVDFLLTECTSPKKHGYQDT